MVDEEWKYILQGQFGSCNLLVVILTGLRCSQLRVRPTGKRVYSRLKNWKEWTTSSQINDFIAVQDGYAKFRFR